MCEEIDLSDNYIEGSGAAAIAGVLKDNMFIVNLVSSQNVLLFYYIRQRDYVVGSVGLFVTYITQKVMNGLQ